MKGNNVNIFTRKKRKSVSLSIIVDSIAKHKEQDFIDSIQAFLNENLDKFLHVKEEEITIDTVFSRRHYNPRGTIDFMSFNSPNAKNKMLAYALNMLDGTSRVFIYEAIGKYQPDLSTKIKALTNTEHIKSLRWSNDTTVNFIVGRNGYRFDTKTMRLSSFDLSAKGDILKKEIEKAAQNLHTANIAGKTCVLVTSAHDSIISAEVRP
jgi:hypothetical protein